MDGLMNNKSRDPERRMGLQEGVDDSQRSALWQSVYSLHPLHPQNLVAVGSSGAAWEASGRMGATVA